MPVAEYIDRRLFREALGTAVDAGLPDEALDVPITLYRAAGKSTLIHTDPQRCPTLRRSHVADVEFTTNLTTILDEKRICRCALRMARLGRAGQIVTEVVQLEALREKLRRLEADPDPHRWHLWALTRPLIERLRTASESLELPAFTDALHVELAHHAEVDRTVVERWRDAPDSGAAAVWWNAWALKGRVTGPKREFINHIVAGGSPSEFTDTYATPVEVDKWFHDLHQARGLYVTALAWGPPATAAPFAVAAEQWALATATGPPRMVLRCPEWATGPLRPARAGFKILPDAVDATAAQFILEMIGSANCLNDVRNLDDIVTCALVASAA